ncbi:MAG: PAS domain-containing protein [Ramlibacter sp.]
MAALLVLAAAGCGEAGRAPARAAGGVLDLTGWVPGRDGTVSLDGEWELLWGRLEAANRADGAVPPRGMPLAVPGAWNDVAGGGKGHGTYRLRVECREAADLALSLPMQHSAMMMWVNGRMVAQQGTPGATEAQARPAVRQQIAALGGAACPLNIVAHVSNFELPRGGLTRSIVLGTQAQIHDLRERGLTRDLFALGCLTVMSLLPLLFFLSRRSDRSPLYFGLFCLSFAVYVALGGERVLEPLLAPLGFSLYLKVVLLSLFLNTTLFTLFLRAQYPHVLAAAPVRWVAVWGFGSALLVLALPASLFGVTVPLLQAGSAVVAVYLVVSLARAALRGSVSAGVLLAGLLVLVAAITHDSLNIANLRSHGLAPWGMLFFALAPGVLLAQRFARALSAEELRALEQRERADLLVRATGAGLLDWDAVAGTVSLSGRFREMVGYPPLEAGAAVPPFYDLVHPDDRANVRERFTSQLRRRDVRSAVRPFAPMEYRLLHAAGGTVWVHAEGIGLCGSDGRTLRFICSFIDISERKRAEQALLTEQRRLDLVVRGARVGIVDWDGLTHDTYYSPRFREIRGYAGDADTSGWPDYFKVMIHPDDRERITTRWVRFIRGKGPEGPQGSFYAPEEYRLSRADGSHVWVQVAGMAVRDAQGFVTRWIAAVIDISERHEQQEALRQQRDQIADQAAQLERQNETLKDNVRLREEVERIGRHDIKTPLNSIIAVPRLLRGERALSPEEDELLGVVERAGYRILSMVNLSLDLYKMENGSYIFRPDAVDLGELLDKVLADLRSHAASKGVALRVVVPRGAPVLAWAEELLCYSLLANLVKNALEASPEGAAVTVTIGPGEPGQSVLLAIHNHGAVPEAVRDQFFQKYATAGKASGTGLGAYSARLMARVQDGDISMNTSEAGGTTLTVRLRAAPEGTQPASARHAAERGATAALAPLQWPALQVLLVDDDEYNLLVVRRYLPSPPLTVATAINGRVALDMAQAAWPDVTIMDLDMPVMGGLEAVGRLRDHERASGLARCRIIALSSHDDEATQRRCLEAGFDHYLTKPVTRELLLDTLARLMGLQAGVAGAAQAGADPDLAPLMAGFVASRRVLLDELAQAIAQAQRETVRRIAHQLAGSFSLYGFHDAAQASRALEAAAAQASLDELAAMADALRVLF